MKVTKAKYLMIPLLILLLAALNTYVGRVFANPTRIYLDPADSVFYTNEARIGDRFNVTVRVEDAPSIGGAQIYLEFNDAIINVTRWFEPTADPQYVFYGRATTALPTPPDPGYTHVSSVKGYVKTSVSLWPPEEPYFTGDGKICIFEFEITAVPPEDGQLTCALHINAADTYLLDGDTGDEVSGVTKEDGTYAFNWAGVPPPYLAVDPISVRFGPYTSAVGQTFNLTVYAKDVALTHSLKNVTFSLTYNQTLASTQQSDVTIDDLWQGPNEITVSGGKVDVTVTNPSTTPAGDVATATIKFTVEYQGSSPPLPLGSLEKSSFVLVDYELWGTSQITPDEPQNGEITIYAHRTAKPSLEISEPEILDTEILPTTSFNINITINNIVDLQSVTLRIIYNPSIITVEDYDYMEGTIFPFVGATASVTENVPGYFTLEGFFEQGHPTFTGSGLLISITFKGKAYGLTYLNISSPDTALTDSAGYVIPLDYVNRNIHVVPEFSMLLILPLFICLTIVAMALNKKRLLKLKTQYKA
jgi:hypothetical protein